MNGQQPSVRELQNELNRMAQELAFARDALSRKNRQFESTEERRQSLLQAIFDAVDIGLILIDSRGKVRKMNNAIAHWLDRDPTAYQETQPGDLLRCLNARPQTGGCGQGEQCSECSLRQAIETVSKTNKPVHDIQIRSEVTVDGSTHDLWFEITADPLKIDDESFIILSLHNITDRRHTDEALRKSEELLRYSHERLVLAQHAAGSGVWDWDIIKGMLTWAPELFQLFGLDGEKQPASFEIWRSIVHPEDLNLAEFRIEESVRNRERLNSEYRIIMPNGDIRWINAIGDTLYDSTGKALSMSGICLDVSGRKRSEEQIRRQIRELSEANDELARFNNAAVNRELRMIELKKQINELCLLNGQSPRYSDPSDMDSVPSREGLNQFRDSGTAALNLMEDAIEAKRRAEQLSSDLVVSTEALKRSQEDLNRAQAVAQTGSWRLDLRNNVLMWSDENHRIFGIPKGKELTYETFLGTIHPDDRDYVDTVWNAAIRGEPYDIEHRLVVDGQIKWVRETAYLEFSPQGELVSAFGITQDVTAIREAVDALKISEHRYHSLFNGMSEGFALHEIVCDDAGIPVDYRFLDINPAFERLTGLKKDDLIGRCMSQLMPGEDPYWVQRYGDVALTGKSASFTHYSPVLLKHYEVFAYQPAPLQFAVLFIDITERIEMEKKLQHLASFPKLNPNPVIEIDTGGSILFANRSADMILEKIGSKGRLQMFMPPDLPDVISLLVEGKKPAVQRDVRVGDRVYAITFTHVKQTNTIRMYSTDVTVKIRARERFKKLTATLEQRVQDRTMRLRAMTLELALVEQRERKRLAGILHDEVQQLLIASKLGLAIAQKLTREAEVCKAIDRVSGFLDESITASRTLAVELSPPVLYEVGLGAALRWLAGWMKEKHQLEVDVTVDREIPGDSRGVCVLLFQSVRELLFNIVKHAQVKRASVSLHSDSNGLIRVTVVDEGTGFDSRDLESISTDPGLGLFSIRERLILVGGKFEILSSKKKGTKAVLTVPLSNLA